MARLTLIALTAISCNLAENGERPSKNSGPSALGVAEREAEHLALKEAFDQNWLLDEGRLSTGMRIPAACKDTMAQATGRDQVLIDAMFTAALHDEDLQEFYDLWGKRIILLKELDRDMRRGCR